MKQILPLIAAALLTVTLAGASSADTNTPRVNRRQARQQERIAQGIGSRALTPREAMRLERGQAHFNRMERRAKADGVVTANERWRMGHAQNMQSRRIYRMKHNGRCAK